MNHRVYCQIIVIYILVMITNVISQTNLEYANYLMKDNDYFRAISEYKKVYFYSNDADIKKDCLLNISKAYLKSNKYRLSIKYSTVLLNSLDKEKDQKYFVKANNYIGLNYYGLRVLYMAEDFFNKSYQIDDTGYSLFYLALVDVEKYKYASAHQKYSDICENYPDSEIYNVSERLRDNVLLGNDVKQKSTLVATCLSTLVPGSGQIYCQHYYDGIQAFMYVGAFAFASYIAYKYDKHVNNNYLTTGVSLSVTALFHLGNILGASKTASYYNLKQKEKFLDVIRKDVFSVDY